MTKRDKQAFETKQRLIHAAHHVFLENGFSETTISQIIKTADVGYGTAYVYFKNKHDLFQTVMTDVMEDFFTVARQTFQPHSVIEAQQLIRTQVHNFLKLAAEEHHMLQVIQTAIGQSEQIAAEWANMRQAFIHGIHDDIVYAQSHKLADPTLDPWIAAQSWYAMNETFLWTMVTSPDTDLTHIVDQLSYFYTKALYTPTH